MGDTSDGPSSAAQSALNEDISKPPTDTSSGFLSKLFGKKQVPIDTEEDQQVEIPAGGLGNLRNLRVEDVAIPRTDVVAVPLDSALKELLAVFKETHFSRLPVYDDTLDSPKGMVHLKDVALKYGFNGRVQKFDLASLLRPMLYVPPSMPIGVLLQKMQTERTHMALAIDEYGGVDGLLTIEDLVEQVVGEIVDEHDPKEEDAWIEEAPGIYICQARAELEEFEKVLGEDFADDTDDEDIDTLGGLVFMLAGRIPARGEVISHPSGYEFEVLDADPRKIKRLRVFKAGTPPAAE